MCIIASVRCSEPQRMDILRLAGGLADLCLTWSESFNKVGRGFHNASIERRVGQPCGLCSHAQSRFAPSALSTELAFFSGLERDIQCDHAQRAGLTLWVSVACLCCSVIGRAQSAWSSSRTGSSRSLAPVTCDTLVFPEQPRENSRACGGARALVAALVDALGSAIATAAER